MAAKVIEISSDGTTWHKLPGTGGEFTVEGESIEDTTLGATFDSALTGLLQWGIKSDGIYKGFAGYLTKIKKAGSGTATTAEAMTLVSTRLYKISNAAKNCWSRTATLTVKDGGVNQNANVLWVDYLWGRVRFKDTYTVTGAVTVDVTYFPLATLGKGQTYSLTMTMDPIDQTDFATAQANGGHRVMGCGLRTVALEMGGFADYTSNFKAELIARNELIVEIDPVGNGASVARGYFRLMSDGKNGDVGALEEESLNFVLNVPDSTLMYLPFSWQHNSTTLATAIQLAIAAWEGELATYQARYLPTGVTGASPLDGAKGTVVFTNISLSGGLSNMNVFNIEMAGVGAYTEV